MRSDEAATWLMETYKVPEDGWWEAITLIPHRSWARPDQLRLARYYLQRIPFANGRPYETFAAFMPVRKLVQVIREHLPNVKRDRVDLLCYYLLPILSGRAKTQNDVLAVKNLFNELRQAEKPE